MKEVRYFIWKLRVNLIAWRWHERWGVTNDVADKENREAFDAHYTPQEHYEEGWCRD